MSDNSTQSVVDQKEPKRKWELFSRKPVENEPEDNHQAIEHVSEMKTDEEVLPISFFQLFQYSTRLELFLDFIGLAAAIAAGATQPFMALLFGNLIQSFVTFSKLTSSDDAQHGVEQAATSFRSLAAKDTTGLVYIGIGTFLCTFVYMYTWVHTGEANAKRIRERYLQATLRQDIQYFDKVGAGEVITRIQTSAHLVQQGISEQIPLVVNYVSAFFTGLIIAYVRSWRLALALTSILPCICVTGGLMSVFLTKFAQHSTQHVVEGGNLAEEVISTVRTAKAFGTETSLAQLYDDSMAGALKYDFKSASFNGSALGVFFIVLYGAYALAFSFGATLINSHHADSGAVVSVILSILIGSFSLTMVAPEIQAITLGLGAAAKIFATIKRIPVIDSADPIGLKPKIVGGEISLYNVKFTYPARPGVQVVKGLTLTFQAGKTTALVGINLKDLNLKWLRSQIGLVSQEPTLFATTIRGNVAHGLIGSKYEHASEEEQSALIKEACVKANAHGFISKLPQGYNTMVGERGFLLSGGQKQRVAIARAIVSDPRILLLDEAISVLDTQSEGIVQDALDKAAAGRTTITIAHRLSTIKDADVIYVMGDGLVLEQGDHNELISADGAYAQLVQSQKLREGQEVRGLADLADSEPEDMEKSPVRKDNEYRRSYTIDELKYKESAEGKQTDYNLLTIFLRFSELVLDQWKNYLVGSICAIATGMVYPAFGIVFANGVSAFSETDNAERRRLSDRTALWFFIIAILSAIFIGFQNYCFSRAAATLTRRLRCLILKATLRQDVEFFDKDENNTGTLTASLSENPQKVNGIAGSTLGAIIQCVSTVMTGSIIGLAFIWKVALITTACTPLLASAGYIRLRVIVLKDKANKKAHEESAHLACEAASSIRTVAALTREEDCLQMYSKSLDLPLRNSDKHAFWSNGLYALSQSMSFFVIALVFWYGSTLVSRQEVTLFEFFVVVMSTTFGAIQAGNAFSLVPDISSAKGAASEIIRLFDTVPEIDTQSTTGNSINPEKCEGHIRFETVHFRYPTRPAVHVLSGLSLEVEPGTYIALVGASGSWKSTVMQLIERFYDPTAGKIYLDGVLISELNVREYRKQIALVSQEPTLYAGTIRFNILLGAIKPTSEVTQEELEDACRKANILEYIQSLPDGFETEVGGKGSQLSGGQKQRISIARALLRKPKVLLLDEATSALDSNSERVVQEALDQVAKGRTTIAIAHRLSTIQNADRIYFVKDGCISESGTPDQLLAKRGDYYEYVQLQALDKQ